MSRTRHGAAGLVLTALLVPSLSAFLSMVDAGAVATSPSALDGVGTSETSVTLPDGILPTTSSSTTTTSSPTSSSSTTTSTSTTTTTTVPPSCDGTHNRGRTDIGVTAKRITLGAVTVDSGIAASFLRDETTALHAVVASVNASGGLCGRSLELEIRDSAWDPAVGYEQIRDLSQRVFALVVNPDSQGLRMASENGFLEKERLPVIGTDGLLANQFSDSYIWPVGPSVVTAMHVIADAQYAAGLRHPSIVYETGLGIGHDGADAYSNQWERLTGSGVPGHPSGDRCVQRSCGLRPGGPQYVSEAAMLADACDQSPPCDAGALALDLRTAVHWTGSSERFAGVSDPSGGAGAGPPLLFNERFARDCGDRCHGLRLWTAFRPPVGRFAAEPAVTQYVKDMRAVSEAADVYDQLAEAAYVGAQLAVHVIGRASGMPGGITRANAIQVLDTTVDWDSGLTVAPLSWSPGNHHAATTLHAFDLVYSPAGLEGYRYVEDSARTDTFAGEV